MNTKAINIAIAEACGWKPLDAPVIQGHARCFAVSPDGFHKIGIPDYCNDLDACHAMERAVGWHDDPVEADAYYTQLRHLTGLSVHPLFYKPAQRAEAFCRTLGIWKEEWA